MKRLLSIFLCLSLLLCSCGQKEYADNNSFTSFTNQLFVNQMCHDALSLNYTLQNPEDYSIHVDNPSLGTLTYDGLKQNLTETENQLSALKDFKKEKLSVSQQVLYNTLEISFRHGLKEKDFLLHNQVLGPTTGIQAQLPVLLCEFRFDRMEDIQTYFALLQSIPDYFNSIVAFEKKRNESSLGTNKSTLAKIIFQCEEFIKSPDKNVLLENFDERMKLITFLNNEEKEAMKIQNKQLVSSAVIGGYQLLIQGLQSLLPSAPAEGCIAKRKSGKSYYTYLLQSSVGTLRSVEDSKQLLTSALNESHESLLALAKKDPSLFQKSAVTMKTNTPNDILSGLHDAMQADFPSISQVNLEVKYVPTSLENYLSPAFYLTPPIDNSTNNVIYINGAAKYANANLFPTLAHEGYPGHLYQSVFFNEHHTAPVQSILNFGGYSEGWATYAEIYAYKYAGLEPDVAQIFQNNTISSLCLYSLCDIGIHYEGWNLAKTNQFLEQYGVSDVTTALTIYQEILDEPCTYLKYALGYLEICELKKQAQELLGNQYTDKTFHKYFLSMGPTWFEVLQAFMKGCLDSYK